MKKRKASLCQRKKGGKNQEKAGSRTKGDLNIRREPSSLRFKRREERASLTLKPSGRRREALAEEGEERNESSMRKRDGGKMGGPVVANLSFFARRRSNSKPREKGKRKTCVSGKGGRGVTSVKEEETE